MKVAGFIRLTVIGLTVAAFTAAMSCGGGGGKISTTPLPSSSPQVRAGTGIADYIEGTIITQEDIPNLSPELQELINHPGWDGPATPTPPIGPAPLPRVLGPEELAGLYGNESIEREPIPTRRASYEEFPVPPDEFPVVPGDYQDDTYDNNPPDEVPPFGSDSKENTGQGDGLEDRIQNSDPLKLANLNGLSYVWLGETKPNFWNTGNITPGDQQLEFPELSAVYQTFADVSSGFHVELGYRADQTWEAGFQEGAYFIEDEFYDVWQSDALSIQVDADTSTYKWYDVLVAPMSQVEGPYTSDNVGFNTSAEVQWFSKDTTENTPLPYPLNDPNEPVNFPPYADSLIVNLLSSDNADIQDIIDDPEVPNTFPVFGAIAQRWADDTFNPFEPPWTGPLGWPVSPPVVLNGGHRMTGLDGSYQFHRIMQMFEKGIMYWDKVAPGFMHPDAVWIFRVPEDQPDKSIFDYKGKEDELVQDAKTVRYGTGGPLGVIAFEWPKQVNVGEPVYFKAFPFGGPVTNDFANDYFVWRFGDGTYGFGARIIKPSAEIEGDYSNPDGLVTDSHDYMASYVAEVMLVLDANDDGAPDGSNPDYVAFGETDEYVVGVKSFGGGGGGATILLVDMDDTDEHLNKWKEDLDAEGLGYVVISAEDVTEADMSNYLVTILASTRGTTVWQAIPWTPGIRDKFMNHVKAGGNAIVTTTDWWFGVGGFGGAEWRNRFGGIGDTYGWYCFSCGTHSLAGSPIASGPGGNFVSLNMQYKETFLGWVFGAPPYPYEVLAWFEYSSSWWPMGATDNFSGDGGYGVGLGSEWYYAQSTTPPSGGTGTSKLLLNLFNYINPDILAGAGGGGGGGGAFQFQPYVGPVQIGDPTTDPPMKGFFAWVIKPGASSELSMIQGGDGHDAFSDPHPFTAELSVISEPAALNFEVMAHGDPDEDGTEILGYEYQFYPDWYYEPGGPMEGQPKWEAWPKKTSHLYEGGVDPDNTVDENGDGDPLNDYDGFPFPVKVRVWDAQNFNTFDEAQAAGQEYWAMDQVYVIVAGPKPIDVEDDGTQFADSYAPDQDGFVHVDLAFKITGGAPEANPGEPYDRVALDTDYDYLTFDFDIEVLIGDPPQYPTYGHTDYTMSWDGYETGNTYSIAIYAEDDVAPNFSDIYVWDDAVFVASPILIVNDNGTSNANAIKSDLDSLGAGYVEVNSNQITTADDLAGYSFVIWAPGFTSYQLSSTEVNILSQYIDNGGNLLIPYAYLYYTGLPQSFREKLGFRYIWSWYFPGYCTVRNDSYGKDVWYDGVGGGTVTQVNGQWTWPVSDAYFRSSWYRMPNTDLINREYGFWANYYTQGAMRDNGTTGDNQGWGGWVQQWDRYTNTNASDVSRADLLWRIIEHADPTLID